MSGAGTTIECKAPRCRQRLNNGMVFCTEHWNALPRGLRDGIYAAKRKPEKYRGAHQAAVSWLAQNHPQTRRPTMQQVKPTTGEDAS
jgi:CDP-diacylglycerol pyrophosphatase